MSDDPINQDELVHADDKIIGRATRWSAVTFVLLVALSAGVYYLSTRKPPPPPPKVTTLAPPVAPQRPQAEIPVARFTDITKEAGITFVHNNGAYGDKLLPETMGGGVAFFDYNNDGRPDLLFINSTAWPGQDRPTTMALYHNDGNGKFSDVTTGSGLDVPFYGMGVAVGDYDNDGHTDIFVTAVGGNHLFHNDGAGKFKEVTQQAGVAGAPDGWSSGATWFDYDNDGKLDLFVCNYVRWSKDIDFKVNYTLVGVGRAYGPPMNYEGAFSVLYHNDGNGKFTDVSARSGVQVKNSATGVPAGKSLGVIPVDLDSDGWMDLVVANDTVQNFVLHNNGDGTFKEIGAQTGIAFDSFGNTRGAMGIDCAHYRNDATLGIAIGNFANEMTALYVSGRDPMQFTDEAIPEGVGPASRLLLKFGELFLDYDLDGWQDLLSCNGHLEDEINKVQASQHFQQPAQLFWNTGDAKKGFVAVSSDKCGSDIFKPIVGRGSAFADIDGDGDLDVVHTQVGGPPLLLRNDQQLGHHWLRLKLTGTTSNRDAIGAVVKVRVGDSVRTQQVMPTRSYLSASELPLTFGLGKSDQVTGVEIIWPGGVTQQVTSVKIDSLNTITQAQ